MAKIIGVRGVMKAQMALFEAMISLILLASAGSMISILAYEATLSGATPDPGLNYQNMFYDFSNIAYRNASTESCLADLNASCGNSILTGVASAYGLSHSQITVDNVSVSNWDMRNCIVLQTECLPVLDGNSFRQACISSCD